MFEEHDTGAARPLWLVDEQGLGGWLESQDPSTRQWLTAMRFRAERHQVACMPGDGGGVRMAVLGLGKLPGLESLEPWHLAGAPDRLPSGAWRIATALPAAAATAAALGWAYGTYKFERYRARSSAAAGAATLVHPQLADMTHVRRMAGALAMARDLINTPASDLTPASLADQALEMAVRCGGHGHVVSGDALREGYPAIHAVGRAADTPPRLVDFSWGDPAAPRVTLVGKGVCFDSGGLDIKNPAGMLLMKKDMGGAACVLALARVIMESALPVRLRVLIPAVENSIAGNAYRPGDVIRTRKGLAVEVGNTDAEGRLVLCDALAHADSEHPDLLVDLATLTGAARVALGPELPALFGSQAGTVEALARHGRAIGDPLWPMPLWDGYDDEIASKIGDLNNVSASPFAGAIIGGLFLRRFVTQAKDWLHVDLYAWNGKDRPGRPVGAEPQAVRALYALLVDRYG
ncbi:MAG TPA: leucyl aminopeptidase family protein [Steroidobacteraceae bacterium]|nr:leucyl aminopeptidase family protein [Steroidobacteraceae bacterium]